MKRTIVNEIVKDRSCLRVLFATSALGMGVDIPNVEIVYHLGPPSTMESYMQQIGRAGRSRKQAKAVLYWNNADIGTNIKHMSDTMRRYCRSTECLRSQIIGYFGFENVAQSKCCSTCDVPTPSAPSDELNKLKIVRSKPLSRPLLIRELKKIFTQWQPDPAVVLMFDVKPHPDDLHVKIADDIQFINDENYLFENFGVWDSKLAQDIFQCLVKHT